MSDATHEQPTVRSVSPTSDKQPNVEDETEEQTTGASETIRPVSPLPVASTQVQDEEAPPTKPPRPTSPQQQAEHTLIEAFPSIDAKVVRAVLSASGGNVEPAFNALLGMSDPDFKPEEAPAQPPRPPRTSQMEQDEMYARQLAQHYQSGGQVPRQQERGNPPLPRRRRPEDTTYDQEEDTGGFNEDLAFISQNVKKGFFETQKKLNGMLSDFRKRFDGDEDDPYDGPTRQDTPPRPPRKDYGSSQSDQLYGIRKSADRSRRHDGEGYDADPRELGDDFAALELKDEETTPIRNSSGRPLANPNLFKATPKPPQSGPVDEVDAAERRVSRQTSPESGSKAAKWQPLTSVAPNPESEDNDPFSVGDSDEEKESKSKDLREADSARLKEAARNSVGAAGDGEGGAGSGKGKLQERERGSISTKDKDAEAILMGKSPE